MRPDGYNDLQVMWAIRDIPASILDFSEKSLLFFFLSVIGNNDSCWSNFPQLVEKTGASESSLRRWIKGLEDKKMIKVKRSPSKGRGNSNEYFLNYKLILEYLNTSNMTVLMDGNKVTETVLSSEIRSQRQGNKVNLTSHRYTREKQQKQREENLGDIDDPKQEQKLYTKKTFTFTHAEMAEAVVRNIQIQPCFNAFVLNLTTKQREEFARWEWEAWFAREWSGGKRGIRTEGDPVCGRCNRPAKGCYCDRPHERPAISGMEKLNGATKHIGRLV